MQSDKIIDAKSTNPSLATMRLCEEILSLPTKLLDLSQRSQLFQYISTTLTYTIGLYILYSALITKYSSKDTLNYIFTYSMESQYLISSNMCIAITSKHIPILKLVVKQISQIYYDIQHIKNLFNTLNISIPQNITVALYILECIISYNNDTNVSYQDIKDLWLYVQQYTFDKEFIELESSLRGMADCILNTPWLLYLLRCVLATIM